MNKKLVLGFLIFAVAPFFIVYFYSLKSIEIWCWLWIILLTWFVNSKSDMFTRGLTLTICSVAIAIGGRVVLKCAESEDVLEMVSQVFLIIGGGVGGNFMAQYLIDKERNGTSKKNKSSA